MKKFNLLCFCFFIALANGHAQWVLTGNAITTGNFLGTTNDYPLIFKVNGNASGTIEPSSVTENTFFGYLAGSANTGINNAGFGYGALLANTTGHSNTAVGLEPLYFNTTGIFNSAFGNQALYKNTTGQSNNATGSGALYFNTTGSFNVADGWNALINNTTGNANVAVGVMSLESNTSGLDNVGVGTGALYSNTTTGYTIAIGDSALYSQNASAGWNTAVGSKSLYSNTSGNANTSVGYHALYSCTTGSNNTAIGYAALYGSGLTGSDNIAIGPGTLTDNSSGGDNVATGYETLYFNSTGNYNTAYGSEALLTNTTGSENTALGCGANMNAGTYTNSTAVGYNATATASNMIFLGNSSVTWIGGSAGYFLTSDGRYKKNIKGNVPGLLFINQLRPVTYNLDVSGLEQVMHPSLPGTPGRKASESASTDVEAVKQKEQISYTGFIAQDVAASAKNVGYDFSGVHSPQGNKDLYSLDYAAFVVPLVKAVQELSNANDSLTSVIDSLKQSEKTLQQQVNSIIQQLNIIKASGAGGAAFIKQNAPNPFASSTTIAYYLPPFTTHARLTIADGKGNVLKSVELENKGEGEAIISAGDLAPGSYYYTLVVNDKVIETKKMLLIR